MGIIKTTLHELAMVVQTCNSRTQEVLKVLGPPRLQLKTSPLLFRNTVTWRIMTFSSEMDQDHIYDGDPIRL
jgi:hypothetical protein